MANVRAWSVSGEAAPQPLKRLAPSTEALFESWLRLDTSLVRDGLVLVAQQFVFPTKERLDLLCIENRSRWLVIELKRNQVPRAAVAQALDYVSQLSEMPVDELRQRLEPHLGKSTDEEMKSLVEQLLSSESDDSPRDVAAVVVGVAADEALLRITNFLTRRHEVPVSVVELQTFVSPSGDQILLREETGTDDGADTATAKQAASLDERWTRVHAAADSIGFGDSLTSLRASVEAAGLFPRPYTRSVMIAPPNARNRYLAVVGFTDKGANARAYLSYGVDEFKEFYPELDSEVVKSTLGESKTTLSREELIEWGQRLAALMQSASNENGETDT